MHKKIIYIRGMHCVACEKLLEDELSHVPFVKKTKADRKMGRVEIYWGEREPNSTAIVEIIRKFGYEAFEKPFEAENKEIRWKGWIFSALIAAMVLFFIRIFQNSGIIPGVNANSPSLNIGIAFLVGTVASVSSCLAVVGAVIIAFSEKYKTNTDNFYQGSIKPNLFFHVGRLLTFFFLGGMLGLIGGELNISGSLISSYTILISIVMFFLALNILGLAPSLSNLGVVMPKGLTKNWTRLQRSNHSAAPFALGGLSFFLPCGFTQSMQLFALASGSFWKGAGVLLFFALGTLPVLMALGVATSWTKNKRTEIFQKAAGMLILAFAIYTFGSGMALWGVRTNVFSKNDQIEQTTADKVNDKKNNTPSDQTNAGEQRIEMHITNAGFVPSVLKIKKGVPVVWVIKGDQVTSCTSKIIVPSLNLQKNIASGDNILRFTPQNSGEIPFSCWMGMVRGKFVVE